MLGSSGEARYSIDDGEEDDHEINGPKLPSGMDSEGVIRL